MFFLEKVNFYCLAIAKYRGVRRAGLHCIFNHCQMFPSCNDPKPYTGVKQTVRSFCAQHFLGTFQWRHLLKSPSHALPFIVQWDLLISSSWSKSNELYIWTTFVLKRRQMATQKWPIICIAYHTSKARVWSVISPKVTKVPFPPHPPCILYSHLQSIFPDGLLVPLMPMI